MSEGQLRCAGSSLFLKKRYGVGYVLTIEKKADKRLSGKTEGEDLKAKNHDEKLMQIVESAVPSAKLLTNVGSELSYQLPMASSSHFAVLFEGLDSEVDKGSACSYGVSLTTLDEVFLLVARGDAAAKKEFASSRRVNSTEVREGASRIAQSKMNLDDKGLFIRHVGALFKKRAAFFRRDKKAWICTTLIPSIFVLCGFLIFKYAYPSRNLDPVTLDLNDYNTGTDGVPRNPVAFNSPKSNFTCQFSRNCVYRNMVDDSVATGQIYHFCGSEAYLSGLNHKCTISESQNIIEQIKDAGATAIGVDVESVQESSASLYGFSTAFQ